MEQIKNVALIIYNELVNIVFGEVPQLEWYTSHLDVIQSVTTVVCCVVMLLLVFGVFAGIWHIITSFFRR